MYDHMLIDGKNAVYRAIYAGLSDEQFVKSKVDFSVIFFRFISSYFRKLKPKQVHLFWDAPKEQLWRKKVWPDYKDGRDTSRNGKYDIDVDQQAVRCCEIIKELTQYMNFRNYYRNHQEADDLIYAFCRANTADKIIIISSDGDFKQIAYNMADVDLYNPLGKSSKFVEIDQDVDPVDVKCYSGEDGDNIIGYPKIGPKRALMMSKDPNKRLKLFEDYGRKTYLRNRALIDLSLCPYLFQNFNYVHKHMVSPICYDEKAVNDIIQKYKITGLRGEITNTVLPFKHLGE